MAWLPALLSAAGSIGGGYLAGRNAGKETKMQKTQRKLVDQLIASLGGQGPFGDLFANDPEAFQKSFVDPAKAMFNNQIAPQIQQQYIASGQQRGTGLDDQLLRAGVDLDTLLNQSYLQFQQGGLNRKQDLINQILGMGAGAAPQPSGMDNFLSSAGGYLSSDSFSDVISDLFKKEGNTTAPSAFPSQSMTRKGYWNEGQMGDPRWGRA